MIHTENGDIETDGRLDTIGADYIVVTLELIRLLAKEKDDVTALGAINQLYSKAVEMYTTNDYEFEEIDPDQVNSKLHTS